MRLIEKSVIIYAEVLIFMKCCGNCEWCITEEEELAQIKEKNYDEEDLNRPLTGDCSLGIDPGENYCCSQHNYMEKLTNIYVLYDENYFGPGYFIVTEYNKEPVILIKMFIAGSKTFPEFKLFAYEKETLDYQCYGMLCGNGHTGHGYVTNVGNCNERGV